MSEEEILIVYLKMKVDHKDWHAVADAAMDLRELRARYDGSHDLIKSFQDAEEG